MVKFVVLLRNGNIEEITLALKSDDRNKTIGNLLKYKHKCKLFTKHITIGKDKIYKINIFNINSNQKMVAYGYKEGGDINKHDISFLETSNKYYEDILVFKINKNNILLDLTALEYEDIYKNFYYKNSDEDNEDNDNLGNIDINDLEKLEKLENLEDLEDEDLEDLEDEDLEDLEDEDLEDEDLDGELLENDNESVDMEDNDLESELLDNELHDLDNDEVIYDDNNDDDINEFDDIDEVKTDFDNEVRDTIMEILNKIIKNKNITVNIEKGVFKYTCDICDEREIFKSWENVNFKKIYINKARSIYTNLDKNSYVKNKLLLSKIKNKVISPDLLASMTYQELFSEHWKKFLDEKYKKEKLMYEDDIVANTDMFKCGRCKQRKCTYYELQTRSADEGMTTFITCLVCGNRWKQ